MVQLPETLVISSDDHLRHHEALHKVFNNLVVGPFALAHNTAGIDTGVALWTPAVGDRIIGLHIEITEGWDVANEKIGIGVANTTDDDLAFVFPVPAAVPAAKPSFARGLGIGIPWGGEVVRITSASPLVARTVVGGNTTGALSLYVHTLSAAAF